MSVWKVRDHDPIVELADNVWTVEGPAPRIPIPRRMCAIKLASGELVIHSAIAMDDESMARLEAWGAPAYLIVPNHYHRLDAAAYAERYPEIQVLAPAPVRGKVEQKVRVDGDLGALPDDPALRAVVLDGGKIGEAALVVDSGGERTAIFCDALFNVTRMGWANPVGWVFRAMGSIGGPRVTRIGQRALVADKQAFAGSLSAIAAGGLARIVPGHGEVIDRDAAAVLEAVASQLAGG